MSYTLIRCVACDRATAAVFSSQPVPPMYCLECADEKERDEAKEGS